MKSRLQEKYRSETVPTLMKRFGWKNVMAVPKLQKITVNIGLGEASQNVKLLDTAAQELGQITGQKAVITRAKKSIANFKIRRGMPIGCAVTLRGDHMYEFLDRLCNVGLPRVRPRPRIYPQVSDVQNLLSRYGAARRNPRRRESELVGKICRRIPLPIF